ncbi:hypothetical protein ACFY0A_13625 [Streptomyces sp. NPDC001698]|uniref:hypothetical protein n=2 Tax=unclassified Streptomyces TaxID=2593676 RepID=UPI0036842546
MGGHTMRTAVALCAAGLLTAGVGTASAAPAASDGNARSAHAVQRTDGRPVLVDCLWKPRQRPGAFILACGDGNSVLSALRWSQWNDRSATARGYNLVNDCKPYCAAGRFHEYPVIVRLDSPAPWKKRPEVQHFTRLSLEFLAGRPEGYPQVQTYPLWD